MAPQSASGPKMMRSSVLTILGALAALPTADSLRARPIVLNGGAAGDTRPLYSKIDTVLRRARKNDDSNRLGGSIARNLGLRWLEMAPADLVEATLVAGNVVLDGFDEGLDILIEAEEIANVDVTAKSYSSLMRLAQAEGRPEEVLALLARTRALGIEASDGLLLGGMRGATELQDWGAVARLYAELSEGPEAAAAAAVELETWSNDPQLMDELRLAKPATAEAPPTEAELSQALTLALRAHCERGDVTRVVELLGRKRSRAAALSTAEYEQLLTLARRTQMAAPLLALRPIDLKRTLDDAVEPRLLDVVNQIGVVGASLGRIERGLVAAAAGVALLSGVVLLTGGFEAAGPSYSTSVFADLPEGF